MFPGSSYINHSCLPNAVGIAEGRTLAFEAPRGTLGWATTGTFGFFQPSSGSGAKREFGFFGGRAAVSSFFAGRGAGSARVEATAGPALPPK